VPPRGVERVVAVDELVRGRTSRATNAAPGIGGGIGGSPMKNLDGF